MSALLGSSAWPDHVSRESLCECRRYVAHKTFVHKPI